MTNSIAERERRADLESNLEAYSAKTRQYHQLNDCLRVWNDEIGGGFFLAVLEKSGRRCRGYHPFPSQKTFDDSESFPQPIDEGKSLEKSGVPSPNVVGGRACSGLRTK